MEKDDVMNKLRIERMTDQIKTDENSIANKRKQLNDMNVEHVNIYIYIYIYIV